LSGRYPTNARFMRLATVWQPARRYVAPRDYYVMGRESYLSHSTGFSPRAESARTPAPHDTIAREASDTRAVTIASAPARVRSVKDLLETAAPSNGSNGNGANGNGANGNGRGSHD
jgi:hypothetical protein